MKHYKVSYEEAEQIVADYQAGLDGASERLVDGYEGYLVNFLNLLNQGELNPHDKPIRNFLGLFVGNPEKKARINQWKYSKTGRTELLRVKAMVQEQFKNFGRDEIWNELVLVLLDMATRYRRRDEKSGFHNYMFQAFHFHAYRRLMRLISDPLVWNQDRMVDLYETSSSVPLDEGGSPENTLRWGGHEAEKEATLAIEDSMDELNENWVNGLTSSDIFSRLNPFERRILKLYYVDGLEDLQIAEVLGCCRATVNRRRLKAKEKIADGY